jgi:serine/threonine protein kinase
MRPARLAHAQAKRGTPCYMAPELFAEGATHSTASDLWSLGCVLYECAVGRPPFLNSSFTQLAHDILNNDPAPIPGMAGRGAAGPRQGSNSHLRACGCARSYSTLRWVALRRSFNPHTSSTRPPSCTTHLQAPRRSFGTC